VNAELNRLADIGAGGEIGGVVVRDGADGEADPRICVSDRDLRLGPNADRV
jgi:hypothetical protein